VGAGPQALGCPRAPPVELGDQEHQAALGRRDVGRLGAQLVLEFCVGEVTGGGAPGSGAVGGWAAGGGTVGSRTVGGWTVGSRVIKGDTGTVHALDATEGV